MARVFYEQCAGIPPRPNFAAAGETTAANFAFAALMTATGTPFSYLSSSIPGNGEK
jgi:hypothetical protein